MGYVIRCDKVTKKFAVQGEMHGEFWVRGRKCHTLRYGAEFGVRFPECPQCVILRSNCLIQIIMATSKLNKEQYANLSAFAGIMLVYNSVNRDGETVQTGQHFFGKDFEPADKSDDEIFRVLKNMTATIWHTIAEEKKLRADADGIRSKFRATTPAEIIICDKSNNRIKHYDLTDSVWARIGLVPTKVDLEKSNRDFAKTIHAAAKAIRNAMNFAPNLASLEKAEKTAKKNGGKATGKAEGEATASAMPETVKEAA